MTGDDYCRISWVTVKCEPVGLKLWMLRDSRTLCKSKRENLKLFMQQREILKLSSSFRLFCELLLSSWLSTQCWFSSQITNDKDFLNDDIPALWNLFLAAPRQWAHTYFHRYQWRSHTVLKFLISLRQTSESHPSAHSVAFHCQDQTHWKQKAASRRPS